MTKFKIFLIILFLSPFFWWNISRPALISSEYSHLPLHLSRQQNNLFSPDNIKILDDMRWYSLNKQIGRFFFNKYHRFPDEIFHSLRSISPPIFFSQPGQANSTPPNTPALSVVILPLSILGIVKLLSQNKFTPLLLFFATALIPLLTGQTSLFYLFPTALFYLHYAAYFLFHQKKSLQYLVFGALILDQIFIILRLFIP